MLCLEAFFLSDSESLCLSFHLFGVLTLATRIDLECGALSSVAVVGIVKKVLDSHQNFLQRNCWFPSITNNGQTHFTIIVDVGVENGRIKVNQRSFTWVVIAKLESYLVDTTFPVRALFPGNTCFPVEQVGTPISVGSWFGEESRRVILSPLFALLKKR